MLTVSVTRGYTLSSEKATETKLNDGFLPTVSLNGLLSTSQVDDKAITKAKLEQSVQDTLDQAGDQSLEDGQVEHQHLKPGKIYFAVDEGSTNAYSATFSPTVAEYEQGLFVKFLAGSRNTGEATFNADGLGPKPIYKRPDRKLETGDIRKNQVVELVYVPALNSGNGGWLMTSLVGQPIGVLGDSLQQPRMNSAADEIEYFTPKANIVVEKLSSPYFVTLVNDTISGTESGDLSLATGSDWSNVDNLLFSGDLPQVEGPEHRQVSVTINATKLQNAGSTISSMSEVSGIVIQWQSYIRTANDFNGLFLWNPESELYDPVAWAEAQNDHLHEYKMIYVPRLEGKQFLFTLVVEDKVTNAGAGFKIIGVY